MPITKTLARPFARAWGHARNTAAPTALVALATLAACSSAGPPAAAVPAALQPPAGEQRAFVHHARGVQIYECRAADGAAPAWAFVAPEAQLFDGAASLTAVGMHGAGPFWEADDGSRVIGTVKARADAPAAGAIPWLLLSTQHAQGSSAGKMNAVRSIQRIHTAGGVAPATGCSSRDDAGKRARVPYTADYVYFTG